MKRLLIILLTVAACSSPTEPEPPEWICTKFQCWEGDECEYENGYWKCPEGDDVVYVPAD